MIEKLKRKKGRHYVALPLFLLDTSENGLEPGDIVLLICLLSYVGKYQIRMTVCAKAIGMSYPNASARAKRLCERGYLRKKGNGQYCSWELTRLANSIKETDKPFVIVDSDEVRALIKDVSPVQCLIMLYLLNKTYFNEPKTCAGIAYALGLSNNAVFPALKTLCEKGLVFKRGICYLLDQPTSPVEHNSHLDF